MFTKRPRRWEISTREFNENDTTNMHTLRAHCVERTEVSAFRFSTADLLIARELENRNRIYLSVQHSAGTYSDFIVISGGGAFGG